MRLKDLLLPMMLTLTNTNSDEIFYTPKTSNTIETKPNKDLPQWKVGEHIIFAKDANTAKKYAKRRGLWKEYYTIEKA